MCTFRVIYQTTKLAFNPQRFYAIHIKHCSLQALSVSYVTTYNSSSSSDLDAAVVTDYRVHR